MTHVLRQLQHHFVRNICRCRNRSYLQTVSRLEENVVEIWIILQQIHHAIAIRFPLKHEFAHGMPVAVAKILKSRQTHFCRQKVPYQRIVHRIVHRMIGSQRIHADDEFMLTERNRICVVSSVRHQKQSIVPLLPRLPHVVLSGQGAVFRGINQPGRALPAYLVDIHATVKSFHQSARQL